MAKKAMIQGKVRPQLQPVLIVRNPPTACFSSVTTLPRSFSHMTHLHKSIQCLVCQSEKGLMPAPPHLGQTCSSLQCQVKFPLT